MSFTLPSLRGLASRFLSRPTVASLGPSTAPCVAPPIRALSTTPSTLAPPGKAKAGGKNKPAGKGKPAFSFVKGVKVPMKGAKGKGGGRRVEEVRDPRMVNMLQHFAVLSPNRIPPPLRMGRNRHLRHWTIHRAWMMFRRKQRQERETNLMRQYQSMHRACEELRLTAGPGTRDEGYLYRVAMEKKGVYGLNGVPIEYARAQTETPAKVAWNHDWKR